MSTVLERYRDLSNFEYFTTATRVRKEITALVTSAAMPKSYRFVLAVPMAETARSLVSNLVTANAFYPNTEHNVTRQRRKLKKLAAFVERGEMTRDQALQSYQSWRGSMMRLDARRTVANMDALFTRLFG